MDTANKRLKEARIQAGYESAAAFAAVADVGETTYRHHENGTGGRGVPSSKLAHYARVLGVSVEWLLTGDQDSKTMLHETSYRPQVSHVIKLSHSEIARLVPPIEIAKEKLAKGPKRERIVVPVAATNAAAMEMPDDSMSRLIPPRTELLVDFDDVSLEDGKPYLIKVGEDAVVRCFKESDGKRWFEADSFQRYYEQIDAAVVDSVMGRIVCSITRF